MISPPNGITTEGSIVMGLQIYWALSWDVMNDVGVILICILRTQSFASANKANRQRYPPTNCIVYKVLTHRQMDVAFEINICPRGLSTPNVLGLRAPHRTFIRSEPERELYSAFRVRNATH